MKINLKLFPLISLLLVPLFFVSCSEYNTYKQMRQMMGTYVEITVSSDSKNNAEKAISAAFDEISKVNDLMSTYNKNSQLSQLNAASGFKPLVMDESIIDVLTISKKYYEISNHRFDVTVGPLIDLWGFYRNQGYLPREIEIRKRKNLVGMVNVYFNDDTREVFLPAKGMRLDLGAVAKGWAVDKAVDALKSYPTIKGAVVNAGGDIYSYGRDHNDKEWSIGVRSIIARGLAEKINLKDKAVVTSGCYERFFILNGHEYCHIIDAVSGYPIPAGTSVTIIADTAAEADALATTVLLMGLKDGMKLIEKTDGVEALFLVRDEKNDSTAREVMSSGFSKYITR